MKNGGHSDPDEIGILQLNFKERNETE